jgi:hypothetical protein
MAVEFTPQCTVASKRIAAGRGTPELVRRSSRSRSASDVGTGLRAPIEQVFAPAGLADALLRLVVGLAPLHRAMEATVRILVRAGALTVALQDDVLRWRRPWLSGLVMVVRARRGGGRPGEHVEGRSRGQRAPQILLLSAIYPRLFPLATALLLLGVSLAVLAERQYRTFLSGAHARAPRGMRLAARCAI